jgi:hypothetical protein
MTTTNQASLDASMTNPTVGQKSLVIVGATGMVGGYALRYALDNLGVKSVMSVGRKKVGILHQNFADCSPLVDALSNQDAVVYCLGTYTGSVSDDQLRVITADYAIEFARVFRDSSPDAAFSFLSGSGADPTGRSRLAFARYKGQAEKACSRLAFRAFIFSGLRISTPSSRATNRTSATGCCARSIRYSGFCSRTRSFALMIWPAPWWILCCDRRTSAKA